MVPRSLSTTQTELELLFSVASETMPEGYAPSPTIGPAFRKNRHFVGRYLVNIDKSHWMAPQTGLWKTRSKLADLGGEAHCRLPEL